MTMSLQDSGLQASFNVSRGDFHLDVEFQLPGRGVTALFGPSGSGKTTCLRCMAGLTRPDSGRMALNGDVWLDTGHGVDRPAHRRPVGYVFQDANLFPHLDVMANLRFGMKRLPRAARRVDAEAAMALLGIAHLAGRMPAALSGGEQQRVAMARALLTSPKLLLMDEPLAALDLRRKQEILPYLERLHKELDIPIVYVSHAHDEVARLADRVVLLENGRVLGTGGVADMLSRLDMPAAFASDASVVVQGTAGQYDAAYGLLSVLLPGGRCALRLAHGHEPAGKTMRLAVRARDVSLALSRQQDGSILNVLPVQVADIAPADNPAHVMVRLQADGSHLLARITRFSRDQLGIETGSKVWAQIKAVSLLA